jgi:hypothetical protein
MTRTRFRTLLVTVLCGAIALLPVELPARGAAPWRITTKGLGPVRVGMTISEVSSVLGVRLDVDAPLERGSTCRTATASRGFEGVNFMFTSGRLARVYVTSGSYQTPSGARVGLTEQQIKKLYSGQLRVEPHAYGDGHYLTFVPKDAADRNDRIVFETDSGRVMAIRAGRLPEVEYIEGCA